MTIEKILEYVNHTPNNTNPNVLSSMIKEFAEDNDPEAAIKYIITTEEVNAGILRSLLEGLKEGGDGSIITLETPISATYDAGETIYYFTKVPDEADDFTYDEYGIAQLTPEQSVPFERENMVFSLPEDVNNEIIKYCNDATNNGGSIDVDIYLEAITLQFYYDNESFSLREFIEESVTETYHITKVEDKTTEDGTFHFAPDEYGTIQIKVVNGVVTEFHNVNAVPA